MTPLKPGLLYKVTGTHFIGLLAHFRKRTSTSSERLELQNILIDDKAGLLKDDMFMVVAYVGVFDLVRPEFQYTAAWEQPVTYVYHILFKDASCHIALNAEGHKNLEQVS